MTWLAGTPLVANIGELRRLVGPTAFQRLQDDGFDLVDLLTTASDQVRASIKGVDPALITNEADYKPAVAEHVLAMLTRRGFLPAPAGRDVPINPFDWSKPLIDAVEPRLSSGDRPPELGTVFPKARNINRAHF